MPVCHVLGACDNHSSFPGGTGGSISLQHDGFPHQRFKPIIDFVCSSSLAASGRRTVYVLRGPNGARDEFHLAATAQNFRKLAMLIPLPSPNAAT